MLAIELDLTNGVGECKSMVLTVAESAASLCSFGLAEPDATGLEIESVAGLAVGPQDGLDQDVRLVVGERENIPPCDGRSGTSAFSGPAIAKRYPLDGPR